MAEAKKTGTTRARKQASAPKIGPELALESVQSVIAPDVTLPPPSVAAEAPMAEPMQFSRFGADRADAVRQALSQAALATANGALEINDKILAAVQSQSDAAIDLWRSAIDTPHLTDALRLHAHGTRQAYERASAQWQDIAEATTRWLHKSMEPLQAMMADRAR